jgi:hypothetical protein
MKIFVDECVTKLIMPHLVGHEFTHIGDTSLRGTKNSVLLLLVASEYDVFLTTDRHIPQQQNLKKFDLVFVIMRGVTNDLDDLLPLLPLTFTVLEKIAAGEAASGDLYDISA